MELTRQNEAQILNVQMTLSWVTDIWDKDFINPFTKEAFVEVTELDFYHIWLPFMNLYFINVNLCLNLQMTHQIPSQITDHFSRNKSFTVMAERMNILL